MRIFYVLIAAILFQFTLHSQTNYNIWYVGVTSTGTGDGTSRINQMAWTSFDKSVLSPGDFVYFGEGTYSPNISFAGKNGTAGALITYQADPSNSDSVIIAGVTGSEGRGFGIIGGSYIRVKGFHVRNVDLGFQVGAGVNVVYVDSCSVRTVNGGCLVRGIYDVANPSVADCDSVWLRWNDIKINKQTTSQTDVIVLAWVNNVFIIGNKLWQDNKMGSSHNDGIQSLPGMGNVTIANNLIITEQEESSQVGMYNQEWAGYKTILYNNVFIQKGTSAGWSHWNATGPGVQIVPAGQTFVYNNTMYTLQNANNFGKADTTTFRNNIFITTPAAGGGALGTVNTPIPSTYTADYNLYWRGNTTYAINLNEAYGRTFSYWQGLGQEANGKNTDPLFVDLSNDNLSLQSTSPCLNAGVNLQSEVEGWGIEGVHWEGFNNPYVPWSNPVARGNNPTIGAWEFTNGSGGNYPPNPPADPFPANGATDQQTSGLTLSWSCTDPDGDPLTYDVFFGTDNNPPLVSANLTDASFNPGNLETNTTYYWKIVAKDNQGHSTSGQIWHFSTIFVDVTPPELLSAALQDSVTLKLIFSEPLEQSSAQNISNYSITGGITVSSASLSGSEVTLTTSPHSPGSYTVTVSNVTDLAGNIISPSANSAVYELIQLSDGITADIKILLQGPFENDGMQTNLRRNNLVPITQPYNISPWNYGGSEEVNDIPQNIVDWILLELRTSTSASSVAGRRAVLLRNDGIVVELNGNQQINFPNLQSGFYYIVVYHRNHLPIMTSNSIFLSDSSELYDFTISQDKAYGTNAMKSLGGGKFGLFSADGNANGNVNNSDYTNVWRKQNGSLGYRSGDFDLNGGVNITDKNAQWKLNKGKTSYVPMN